MEMSTDTEDRIIYTPLDFTAGSQALNVVSLHATGKFVYTRYLAIQSKKLIISRQDFSIKTDTSVTLPLSCSFTGLVVATKNNLASHVAGEDHFLKKNQFNLIHLPRTQITHHFRKGEYTIISIPMNPGYLNSLVDYKGLINDFSQRAGKAQATWCATKNLDVPGEVKSTLRDFSSRLERSALSQLYFEKLTLDLMRLLLDRLNMESAREATYLTTAQKEIIWKVRAFMQHHLESFFTVAQVAAWHDIDQASLTRGYKLLTGKNLMEEISDMRMNKARELLERGITVERTAHAVGYKKYNNFSSAFKRKFGFPPSYLTGSRPLTPP
jgi:AraC-like DNA-binding protein